MLSPSSGRTFFLQFASCRVLQIAMGFCGIYWIYFLGAELPLLLKLGSTRVLDFPSLNASSIDRAPSVKNLLDFKIPELPSSVPRIIHSTWKSEDLTTVPDRSWKKAYQRCKQLHPSWTIKLWTDTSARQFIAQHYSWFLGVYDTYRYPIQRVDAFRYFALYHYGGIYRDMDVGCNRPFDALSAILSGRAQENIGNAALFPQTWPIGVSNDFMSSTPRHPLFLRLIQDLRPRNKWYGSPYLTVFFSTGPLFLTLHLLQATALEKSGLQILAPELYGGSSNSFVYHLHGSTWHGDDVAALDFVRTILLLLLSSWSFWVILILGVTVVLRMSNRGIKRGRKEASIV